MKNKDKDKEKFNKANKKEPRNIKEIVPLSSKEPRINNQIKNPDNFAKLPQRNFVSPLEPVKLFPEWPSDDDIKVKKYSIINYTFKI